MSIYITGDCHGDFGRFATKKFPQLKEMDRDDFVIITGDFGGVWSGEQADKYHLDWLEDKPFTTLFADGNHENFDLLNAYPEQEWHGGKVHRVRSHVLHLMRGQLYNIDGHTFFTMGGAASHDTEDGILDPNAPDFRAQYIHLVFAGRLRFRILGKSWWPEELPSGSEYAASLDTLERDVYLDGRKLTGGKLAGGEQVPADWEYYARRGSVAITAVTMTSASKGNGQGTLSATFTKPANSGACTNAVDTVSTNYFVNNYNPQTEKYLFSDGADTRYRDAIRSLAESGVINGFKDGTFRPKAGLTRAQACTIPALATGNGGVGGNSSFTDISGHWAETAIAWCASNGIVSGYGNGKFGPNDPLTGYAWSTMLFAALDFDLAAQGISGSNWKDGIMGLLRTYSLDQGMNNFYPEETIKREEACQLVYDAFVQKPISAPA